MKFTKLLGSTALVASLAACDGDGLSGAQLVGPDADIADAEAAFVALDDRVIDVLASEGSTPFVDLPGGDASYTGIISGGPGTENGSGSVTHYADLSLTTDFSSDAVTGSITNFVTDVTDFENPTGTIDVTGTISDNGGTAVTDFSGSGTLTGDGITGEYDTVAIGTFVGTDGEAIEGNQDTNFNIDDSGVEFSDGDWFAERN